MFGFTTALVVLSLAAFSSGIPLSLLSDVKQAEMMSHSRMTNKVKRAQEVIMFGNQQNRAGDGRGYALPHTDKRGVEDENSLSDAVTENPLSLLPQGPIYPSEPENGLEEPKTMAQYEKEYSQMSGEPSYAQRLQNSILKSELYTDPAAYSELRYYDMDSRRKRDARAFRSPNKRSRQLTSGRAKRDLDIDPEEFLALLSIWESERRNKAHENRLDRMKRYDTRFRGRNIAQHSDLFIVPQRGNSWPRYKTVDSNDFDLSEGPDDVNDDDEDDSQNGAWLDGPAIPSPHHFSSGDQWDRQRFSEDRRKRFMVSKRRQEGDMYSLAQLLNGPRREPGAPLYHRLVL